MTLITVDIGSPLGAKLWVPESTIICQM